MALKERFRPEFLNRIDEIILFRPLGREDLAKIAERMLEAMQHRAAEIGVRLSFAPEVSSLLASEAECARYGARPLRRAVIRRIEDPLSTKLLAGEISRGERVLVSVADEQIVFSKASPINEKAVR